jgi:predicted 3-demethylubiquinone-9 3-methyltransferase (glyoxalase superfamily)
MQKITPFLWFKGNAEEAVAFYTSVFKDSKVKVTTRYSDAGPEPKGTVLTIAFEIGGLEFVALNGESDFEFSMATSFVVNCDTQAEVDYYWEKLSAGGKEIQCGWLTDRFGLAWQIVPTIMFEILKDNSERTARTMRAMFEMKKLDIAKLRAAYDGKG